MKPRGLNLIFVLVMALVVSFTALLAPPAISGEFRVDDFSGPLSDDGLPEGWKELHFPKVERHTEYGVFGQRTGAQMGQRTAGPDVAEPEATEPEATGPEASGPDVTDASKTGDAKTTSQTTPIVLEVDAGAVETGGRYLCARSRASASALYKEVSVELKELPILSWRWRVGGVLPGGDARRKSGDDYPARVYVTFAYVPERTPLLERVKYRLVKALYGKTPANAINYIWANKLKKNEALPNPYTTKVMMVAVESGVALAGDWVTESRNVYEDYLKFFGGEPPVVVSIAVMTDSDNTKGEAEACYDDIVFSSEQ